MIQPIVERILKEIDSLSEPAREQLERRLHERAEAEWRREAKQARQEAKARGIDQAAIDAAVHKHRYGA